MRYDLWKQFYFLEKTVFQLIQSVPFIPWLEVTTTLWKGHFTIPKRSQRFISRVLVCFWILVTRVFGWMLVTVTFGIKALIKIVYSQSMTILLGAECPFRRSEKDKFDEHIFQMGWNHQLEDVQSFVFPRSKFEGQVHRWMFCCKIQDSSNKKHGNGRTPPKQI